jgi:hypothetical protein
MANVDEPVAPWSHEDGIQRTKGREVQVGIRASKERKQSLSNVHRSESGKKGKQGVCEA